MKPEYIIIHHSAGVDHPTLDFQGIRKWHVEHNEWKDIGYHYVIEKINDRYEILVGRMLDEVGSHASGHNSNSIGICCIGNYEIDYPDGEMVLLLRRLVNALCSVLGIKAENVIGHRDTKATACPGKHLYNLWRNK